MEKWRRNGGMEITRTYSGEIWRIWTNYLRAQSLIDLVDAARAGQMLFTLISYSPNSFAVIRVK